MINNTIFEQFNLWEPILTGKQNIQAIFIKTPQFYPIEDLNVNLAKLLLCLKPEKLKPCNKCQHCQIINIENTSPDLITIKNEKTLISIEQIRQLCASLSHKPSITNRKLAIINCASLLSNSAANSLLKTLEEPNSKQIIILTDNWHSKVLPTITSRCVQLELSPLPWHKSNKDTWQELCPKDTRPWHNACHGLTEMIPYIKLLKEIESDFKNEVFNKKSIINAIDVLSKYPIKHIYNLSMFLVTQIINTFHHPGTKMIYPWTFIDPREIIKNFKPNMLTTNKLDEFFTSHKKLGKIINGQVAIDQELQLNFLISEWYKYVY